MGREIRRVPIDWEHPWDELGRYKPLYDDSFDNAARLWLEEFRKFMEENPDGRTPLNENGHQSYFWEWYGTPPDEEYYRPDWPAEAMTAYQIYETVSEGTPVSPVLATKAAMHLWLLGQGHSQKSAAAFIDSGWAPSMIFADGQIRVGIDSLDV